jgi:SAM-dependent methyltransferase
VKNNKNHPLTSATLKDIIEWDIVNWSKALDYWETKIDLNRELHCLEIGGRNGGLSLWLALNGNHVVCSDLESPKKNAFEIHKKYNCHSLIQYEAIDAADIPYRNHFDLVIFKSILGGVSNNNRHHLKQKTIDGIHRALKEDGVLLFAENIETTLFHRILRTLFISWGKEWNYLKFHEIKTLFSSFKQLEYITVGFFGTFGRTERQRRFLGKVDGFFDKIVPEKKRYILIGIAKK